ncbi:MAG: L-rhamnose mutarotase [Bacteroidales bacterium]|nr:L-rhamnose mutarotase [Bacteroidales bacterium]
MKRYCQTLELANEPELIEKYLEVHRHVWPEIIEGQHQVGILSMEIYNLGRNLFMIVDTVDDFDWERDMLRLSKLPRQAEWEAYVSKFQGCSSTARSDEKWKLMDKIFDSEK